MKQTLAALLALLTLFSCGAISAFAATPGEIKAEEERMKALIDSLDSEKITKITIERFLPNQGLVVNESSSEKAIKAWVDLFQQMEIKGVEFEYLSGGFGTIYIHDERGNVRMGCLTGEYITNEGSTTMCRIENHVELNSDMESAFEMLVPTANSNCWERLPDWLRWFLRYFCFGWIWM